MEPVHIAGQVMTITEKAFSPTRRPAMLASVNADTIYPYQSIFVTTTEYLRPGDT